MVRWQGTWSIVGTSNTDDLLAKHSSSRKQKDISRSKSTGVSLARRNSDFDSIDSDEEVPSRRLQRSKIIASFFIAARFSRRCYRIIFTHQFKLNNNN